MDDNDTMDVTDNTVEDNSFEEWVVAELNHFYMGATTDLKTGLVDRSSFGVGTWYLNRWLPTPTPMLPKNQSKGVARNSLPSSHTVMCDWLHTFQTPIMFQHLSKCQH